jgi:hypothetical protein
MGFFGALSALAQPGYQIAGAQDALRKQQEDSALKQAQTSVHQMAAEGARQQNAFAAREEQERQTVRQQLGIPLRKHKDANGADYTDYWTPSGVKSLPDAPSSEDRFKSYLDSAEKSGLKLTPEQKEALMPEFYGVKAPATLSYKNIPGAAGQPQERVGSDGKKTYVRMMYDPSTNSNVEQPMPPGYTPPAPKASSPTAQYANLLSKQILANRKQGPPLTNEEAAQLPALQSALTIPGIARMKAMAEFNAQNHLQVVTGDDGQDIVIPVAQAVAAANTGQPYGGPGIGAATGMDKKNSMLAQSAVQQVDRMKQILKADPSLTGPGSGQLTRLQMWLGTQDPAAQQFLISSLLGSEHGVAVFGGRNIHTINDLNKALGDMKTNPAALNAALDVVKETMQPWVTADNRLKNPRAAGAGGSGAGGAGGVTGKKHSLRTAMALPFNKGKTAAQVKADLESHGYTVAP